MFPEIDIDHSNLTLVNIYKDLKIQEFITNYTKVTIFPTDLTFFGNNYYFIVIEIITLILKKPFILENMIHLIIKIIDLEIYEIDFLYWLIKKSIKIIPVLIYKLFSLNYINKNHLFKSLGPHSLNENLTNGNFVYPYKNIENLNNINEYIEFGWEKNSVGYFIKFDFKDEFFKFSLFNKFIT